MSYTKLPRDRVEEVLEEIADFNPFNIDALNMCLLRDATDFYDDRPALGLAIAAKRDYTTRLRERLEGYIEVGIAPKRLFFVAKGPGKLTLGKIPTEWIAQGLCRLEKEYTRILDRFVESGIMTILDYKALQAQETQ